MKPRIQIRRAKVEKRTSVPSVMRAACAGAFLAANVEAVSNNDEFAQLDATNNLTMDDLVDGMLAQAKDGLIRIPLKKERTDFLSQIYTEADPIAWNSDPKDVITMHAQTDAFDLNDPTQLAQAISLGMLKDVQVKEPLTNS